MNAEAGGTNGDGDHAERARLAHGFADIASAAGAAILGCGGAGARVKSDGSPVCRADEAAERVIGAGLAALCAGLVVISEESNARARAGARAFVLVDPLDGTVEFLKGSGDYTVNLALIEDGRATVGCVFAPATGRMWLGLRRGSDASLAPRRRAAHRAARDINTLHTRRANGAAALVGMMSASHSCAADRQIGEQLGVSEWRSAGSSIKLARVAEGAADLYPRLGTVMEWDIAAGDAVLTAAGGGVRSLDGQPVRYGKEAEGWR